MDLIRSEFTLRNPLAPDVPPVVSQAQVDWTIMVMSLPASLAEQLKLSEAEKREVSLADGSMRTVPNVGPSQVSFDNRGSFCGAMILGDTLLLGAVAMEDMDLIISPKHQRIEINPDSPNFAQAIVR